MTRHLDRLQRRVRGPALAGHPHRRRPPSTSPRPSSCAWTPARGAPALAAGQLLIDSTTATTKHLSVGVGGPGQVRPDRRARPCGWAASSSPTPSSAATWSATASSWPTSTNPLPGGRPAPHRRAPARPPAMRSTPGSRAYPNLKIQTRAAVREVAAGPGQPAAGPGLRPAGPGRAHRPHRHREHPDAVGVRAHPRDRPAAGRGDEAPPGPVDDPIGVGDPLAVRRHASAWWSEPPWAWPSPPR